MPAPAQTASPFPLTGVQRQVKVGSAHDPAEQEAERTADHVISGRSCMEERLPQHRSGTGSVLCKTRVEPTSHNSVHPRSAGMDSMDAAAHHAISNKGAGMPMLDPMRRTIESRMGVDLSGVRVHDDASAHQSAASLNARAFTHQHDIWLGRGESQNDGRLMAHEAAHVVQQSAAVPAAPAPSNAVPVAPAQSAPVSAAPAPASAAVAVAPTKSVPVPPTPAGMAPPLPAAPPLPSDSAGQAPSSVDAHAAKSPMTLGTAPAPAAHSITDGAAPAAKTHVETPEKGPGHTGAASPAALAAAAEATGQKPRPLSPDADPAFMAVVDHTKSLARRQKTHAPAALKAAAAHAAVISPSNEVPSRAAAKHTDAIDQEQPKPFNRAAFKKALLQKIADTAPKTLEDADDFKDKNNLNSVKSDLNSQVAEDKKESQGPLAEKVAEKPDTSGIEPTPSTPLPAPDTGAAPQMAAAGAAPKPAGDRDISLQSGPQQVNQQMTEANVTDEQLQASNEPEFQSALGQKKDLEKESVAAPRAYRAMEPKLLHAAQTEAQTTAVEHVAGIHGARKHVFGGVADKQAEAKAEEEKQRNRIFSDIEHIYETTKSNVEARLQKLDTDVNTAFDAGSTEAQTAFEDLVALRMHQYKRERFGGKLGGLRWLKDKLMGLPHAVDAFYQEGLQLYLSQMDGLIDRIATVVETGLNDAKGIVAAGKASIQTYLSGLQPAWQETGKKAAAGIQDKFGALEQSVTDKQNQLIDSLAKKYNDNLQKVNARIDEMKEENAGLVHKVAGAIKGVIQAIRQLKDLITNVLSRAAAAIGMIIAHPIKFLGNLVEAGKLGFNNFKDHILEHLKEGFLKWLFGAAAATGIELPRSFDLAGIFSLVMQILGLTRENVRARAVSLLGEKVVKSLESAVEIFKILITKGPAGLWEHFNQETLTGVLQMAIQKIKSFVMEEIVYAGITWILGLLNPFSAFIKACKAIYSIVMFFVTRGSQILDLINAIIDSIPPIAQGQIDAAAGFIEKSLARAIPVIIGFLASLLGVGGITEKITEVIEAIRKPINDGIDWVIQKAVGLAKAAGSLLGIGKKDESPKTDDPQHDAKVTAGIATLHENEQAAPSVQKDHRITHEDALAAAAKTKAAHPVFKSITVLDGEDTWNYVYEASSGTTIRGLSKEESIELGKAKTEFAKEYFGRDDLESFLGLGKTATLDRLSKWKEAGRVFVFASAPSDVSTQYTFDREAAGYRPTNPNNREKYGYHNPAKASGVGLQILSKKFNPKTPRPIERTSVEYHTTKARYDSARPHSEYENFKFPVAILGHKEELGASEHWNTIGHKQTKAENQAWNNDPDHYQGPEHEDESAASGGSSPRYEAPSRARGSKRVWYRP